MAKDAFNKKKELLSRRMNIDTKKKNCEGIGLERSFIQGRNMHGH